jgi:EAL domain-containing protein (putative c-di-GMP-specific phosphodiesterase class I)
MQAANEIIHEIRKIGIRISLDDFGSGYSSFGMLKQIPFDTLKIDRSFIANTPENTGDTTIVACIISIGHSLNLKVIAEGIEKESQLLFLESHDCDMAQGFYFYHPLSEEKIIKLLENNKLVL